MCVKTPFFTQEGHTCSGSTRITDTATCAAAGTATGNNPGTTTSVENTASYPAGCYNYNHGTSNWLNHASTGIEGSTQHTLLCKG